MSDSILPPSSSDLEQRLESAISAALPQAIEIDRVWNPQTCPIEILPYLAWALSVDNWSSTWPEATKRRVVADSIRVHKLKGTRPAVEVALSSINIETEITEWFEQIPKGDAGTFDVAAFVSDRGINEALYYEIKAAVDAAKNVRSHYTLTTNLVNRSDIGAGVGVSSSVQTLLQPLNPVVDDSDFSIGYGMMLQSEQTLTIQPLAALPYESPFALSYGFNVQATVTNTIYPEV